MFSNISYSRYSQIDFEHLLYYIQQTVKWTIRSLQI